MLEIIIPCAFDYVVRALMGDPVKPREIDSEVTAAHYLFEGPAAAQED
jgi:hypothetical protein